MARFFQDTADPTKFVDFDPTGVSTGTTRTITMRDRDITLLSQDEIGYETAADLATRDANFPAANYSDGFRVKVESNNLVYVIRGGSYVLEGYQTTVGSVSTWNAITEQIDAQRVFVDSLKTAYRYNGTSWEQVGCCTVGTEGAPLIIESTTAISSASSLVGNVFTFGSGSQAVAGETLTTVRWTWTLADPGFPNDGRVIVFEADTPASPTSAVSLISDTGGTPAARVVTGQITGDASGWSLTADASNDIVLTAGGTITVDLFVQDSAAATSTAGDIL